MGRRLIFGLLGAGLAVILLLGGAGLYKIHTLKVQTQDILNKKLVQLAQDVEKTDIKLDYKPFECQGIVFFECKSEKIALYSPLISQEALSLKNVKIKADEIDFKSLAILVDSEIIAPKVDKGIQEYLQAFFPNHLKMRLKLSEQDETNYKIDTRILFEANNIDYQEEINASILSPEIKEKGFFYAIENLDFLKEKMSVKNAILTFTSKDFRNKLLEIVKKHYENLSEGMIALMVGASVEQFKGTKQIQDMIAGLGALTMGEAQRVKVYITPINPEVSIFEEDFVYSSEQILEKLVENYNFETKLEK